MESKGYFTIPTDPSELPMPPEVQKYEMDGTPVPDDIMENNEMERSIARAGDQKFDLDLYVSILKNYVQRGESPVPYPENEPLYNYLYKVLNDHSLKVLALRNEQTTSIFYEQMAAFIRDAFGREKFNLNRAMSEKNAIGEVAQWSVRKKRDGWPALWEKLDAEYKDFGFCSAYYKTEFLNANNLADPNKWKKMLDDWKEAFNEKLRRKKESDIAYNGEQTLECLKRNLHTIPEYLSKHQVENDEFFQCWGLMSGMWNTYDFERLRKLVALQKSYPDLVKAANAMGRIADDDGNEKLKVSQGDQMPMEHSTKSDIEGITVGNDISSLLPTELVNYVDDDMNSLFLYKFITQRLQVFKSQSNLLSPSRRLQLKKARQKGPMIVCLDTSGSMSGQKETIAHSLLIKLLELSTRQDRKLMLIAFSVSANPIDIRKDRGKLLDFFKKTACGDTDATQMLTSACGFLEKSPEYMNADLMLISDFEIPMVNEEMQKRIKAIQDSGTRFYGMQIGRSDNFEWPHYFDRIWHITYNLPRGIYRNVVVNY